MKHFKFSKVLALVLALTMVVPTPVYASNAGMEEVVSDGEQTPICTGGEDCLVEGHENGCPKVEETPVCTGGEGCLVEGHENGCPKIEETPVCTGGEGCLVEGHENGCPKVEETPVCTGGEGCLVEGHENGCPKKEEDKETSEEVSKSDNNIVEKTTTVIAQDVSSTLSYANSEKFVSETHDVFSRTESTIAPGVTQSINYAYAKDGKQMVYYVATADISREDVVVQTSYFKQHENGVLGMAKLTDQMAYAKDKYSNPEDEHFISEYYTPVVGVNGSFYNMSTGQPTGTTYIDGVSFGTKSYDNFFAILKDGTAVIDYRKNEGNYTGDKAIVHAVAGSQWLVRDGQDVTANISGAYNTDRHSRTCVGITADGKVVFMSLDGRQEPFSCGGSMHELAQIMLEADCVAAVNLDGGGSTTFASRPEGEDEVKVINRPSDGSERAISAGLMIATTTEPTNVFDHVNLTVEKDYVTPYSEVKISAVGVSTSNNSAEIPEDAVLQLADSKYGTIENGVFKANGTTGDVVIEMIYDGKTVGSTTVHVVIPDLTFDSSSMTVPYSKKFKLNVSGTTNGGMNKVVLKDSDLVFELSDSKMGTIEGAYYTSCDMNSGVKSGTITVKCAYDETKTATANITFGIASVIAEDFENQDITGWSAKSAYARAGKGDLTYGRFESCDLNLVDSTNGKVRNGDYALELVADFSTTTASGYKAINYSFPAIDLTGATNFGMWMYLPVEDVHYLEFDIGDYLYYIEDDANVNEEGWYYISAPVADVGTSVSTFSIYNTDPDASYFNVFNEYKIYIDDLTIDYSNATEDRENPYFKSVKVVNGLDSTVDMNGQTLNENVITVRATASERFIGNYTGLDTNTAKVIVDGVELDKSEYTCDSNGMITVGDIKLSNGTHSFRFEISDNSGNTGVITRKIVINEANGEVSLVRRSSKALPLAGSIEYFDVVAKNIENVKTVTLEIDLDTLNIWELEGADVAYGFEMDYTVDDRSNTAMIKLTKTGNVELSGESVIAALPVRVWQTTSYLQDKYINAGLVSNSPSSKESMVVSTPYVMWQTDRTRLVRIELDVVGATVEYSDGKTDTFASEQINVITELNRYRTEGYYNEAGEYVKGDTAFCKQGKECTHLHSAEAIADKAATCTESGYVNRTFCEECNSFVDWGTSIPATGHTYEIVDGILKCACEKLYTGMYEGKEYVDGKLVSDGWQGDSYYLDGVKLTGIQLIDENYYDFGEDGICQNKQKYTGFIDSSEGRMFATGGKAVSGWTMIDGEYYYFDLVTKFACTGRKQFFEGFHYTFADDGKLTSGVWYTSDKGTQYYYGPGYPQNKWWTVDGKEYYFDANGYRYEGVKYVTGSYGNAPVWYDFGEDGALVEQLHHTGLYKNDGNTYYLKNGVSCKGLILAEDGCYYYFNSTNYTAIKDQAYWVSNTNDTGMQSTFYTFDVDGKMIIDSDDSGTDKPEEEVKNGIVTEDGVMYYYVDGIKTYAGLIKVGEDYYYVNSSCKIVTSSHYWVSKTNGYLPAAFYDFGTDGKMIIDSDDSETDKPEEEVKNGIVTENGVMYYYVDGVKTYAGLIKVGEDYYYVNSSCKIVTSSHYWVSKTNDYLPATFYDFGTDGKMIIDSDDSGTDKPEEEVKNGIVTEDGVMYYYVDGVKTYAGLIKVGEDYYYVNSSCKIVTSSHYWVSKTNGYLPATFYDFGTDGKMIIESDDSETDKPEEEVKNGIVTEDGVMYYYVDGVKTYAGLIKVGEDYYYVNSSCKIVTSSHYWVSKTNGYLPATFYDFGLDGKMIR